MSESPKRLRLQFKLWWLFVVVTICSIGFAVWRHSSHTPLEGTWVGINGLVSNTLTFRGNHLTVQNRLGGYTMPIRITTRSHVLEIMPRNDVHQRGTYRIEGDRLTLTWPSTRKKPKVEIYDRRKP